MNQRQETYRADYFNWLAEQLVSVESPTVTLAHELKAPLGLIRQLALFVQDEELSDIERQQYLTQIQAISEQSLDLVANLSKIAGLSQLELDFQPINPVQVYRQVEHDLASVLKLNGKRLQLSYGSGRYLALADFDCARLVLRQFCLNAINYSDPKSTIKVRLSRHGDRQVRVAVRDFGPRLPLEIWRGLKRRSALRTQAITNRPLASGIGLIIADQFATKMNCQIGAISHSDGATFYLDMPLSGQLSLLGEMS